jgi:hypothetical protein
MKRYLRLETCDNFLRFGFDRRASHHFGELDDFGEECDLGVSVFVIISIELLGGVET